jgi:hypothetical protein
MWCVLLQTGFYKETEEPPPDAVVTFAFVAAAAVSATFAYRHARGRDWSAAGATMLALLTPVVGCFAGQLLAFLVLEI